MLGWKIKDYFQRYILTVCERLRGHHGDRLIACAKILRANVQWQNVQMTKCSGINCPRQIFTVCFFIKQYSTYSYTLTNIPLLYRWCTLISLALNLPSHSDELHPIQGATPLILLRQLPEVLNSSTYFYVWFWVPLIPEESGHFP